MASEASGKRRFLAKIFSIASRPEFLVAGIGFWLPDLAYHYVMRSEPSRAAVFALSLGMPLMAAWLYPLCMIWARAHKRSTAFSILAGIWILGPLMMMLGWTFAGAGFRSGLVGELAVVVVATAVPFFTLLLSGYDLTVFGLVAATVYLVIVHLALEKGRHILAG